MKLITIITVTIMCCFISQASVILSEGESFIWNFDSQDFIFDRVDLEPLHHSYQPWALNIDNISSDEIFSIAMYEDSLSDVPFHHSIYTNSGSAGYAIATANMTSNMKWSDKQGLIKVDALRGTIGFSSARAITIADGEYFTASIPEPNSIALIIMGVGTLYLRRKRLSNRRIE